MDKSPYFSIILSTRDRPEIFLEALNSVVRQSFDDREIIVVVDGSSETNLARYRELMEQFKNITFLELLHRPNGHGQSYTMNYGVHKSTGKYLCFLDDDDYWADDDYLARLHHSLVTSKNPVEVHYSNQRAVHADGTAQHLEVWLEGLIGKLGSQVQHTEDCYFVSPEFLLGGSGFAHLNCTVFERNFYTRVGGMDENIRYENDRDIFIRSMDTATTILFSTRYISVHNIPDRKKKSNMSTVSSELEKKLYQLRVYDKGICHCQHDHVVRFCARAKVFELKHATRLLVQNRRHRSAAFYAKAALVNGFNFRWLAYTAYLTALSWFRPNTSNG